MTQTELREATPLLPSRSLRLAAALRGPSIHPPISVRFIFPPFQLPGALMTTNFSNSFLLFFLLLFVQQNVGTCALSPKCQMELMKAWDAKFYLNFSILLFGLERRSTRNHFNEDFTSLGASRHVSTFRCSKLFFFFFLSLALIPVMPDDPRLIELGTLASLLPATTACLILDGKFTGRPLKTQRRFILLFYHISLLTSTLLLSSIHPLNLRSPCRSGGRGRITTCICAHSCHMHLPAGQSCE